MTGRVLRRGPYVAAGALVHLGIWPALRPDLAGPVWDRGRSLETWLALEALAAVLTGATARDRDLAAGAVLGGWGLQMARFAVLGEHWDDTLWGVALFGQAFLAVVALGLALATGALGHRPRHRS